MKPDGEGFALIVERWAVAPDRILFLDDNALNVEAARAAGLRAARAEGIDETRAALDERGVRWEG